MSPDQLIHIRRHELKLTQPALAKKLDISERQLRRYEQGDSPIPRVVAAFVEQLREQEKK